MDEEKIKRKVHCCSCGHSLKSSKFLNMLTLDKEASWKHPTWLNILVKDKYPEARAVAILCDACIDGRKEVKEALEWDEDLSRIEYHDVASLKDLPEITSEEILNAESA